MSYRDLRNFTEMMRALGYPRLISLENFRSPNFPLVAEILIWLVKRYDPGADIPTDIETQQDRVIFIKLVAHFMAVKAHIKLNTKKLYMADGYAVKELLKMTSLLYSAMKTNVSSEIDVTAEESHSFNFTPDLTSKIGELKLTRQLASEITTSGASLYDFLSKEVELREVRQSVIAKPLEITEIEKSLINVIKGVEEEIKKTNQMIENVASDEVNLDAKIEKRKLELERSQKRLQTLKSVRPAFMDEYERLEQELAQIYEQYIIKFRCLAFLEQQLEEMEKLEQEQMEERQEQIRRMVEKLRQEELLRSEEGDSLEDLTTAADGEDGNIDLVNEKPKRPQPAASGSNREPGGGGRRVFGSMTGGQKDDSLDSDLDLEGEDDDATDDSDDDLDLENLDKKIAVHSSGLPDSDNDF